MFESVGDLLQATGLHGDGILQPTQHHPVSASVPTLTDGPGDVRVTLDQVCWRLASVLEDILYCIGGTWQLCHIE